MQVERRLLTEESREAWGMWLSSMPWHFFATFTWRPREGQSYASHSSLKCVCRFLKKFGVERAFLSAERFRYGDRDVHIHGLLYVEVFEGVDLKDIATLMWEAWFRKYGMAKICLIRGDKDVAKTSMYCAKYVCKPDSEFDVELFGDVRVWRRFLRAVSPAEISKKVVDNADKHDIVVLENKGEQTWDLKPH